MLNKENLRSEFWKVIGVHYEKECYTDAIKDACLYIIQLVQERGELENLDGMQLMNTAFSESNPKILINNNETESEKNEQKGFALILKGIISAIRNPISHNREFTFSKEEADSILLFMNNYILPRLLESKDFKYVDNWFEFIFHRNDNDSEKFSDMILKNMSKKDKFYLMIQIVNNLNIIGEGKYEYLINKLYNSLTLKEKNEIVLVLNRKLIDANDDEYLRMFFNHFNPIIWKDIDELVRIRIEAIVYNSIEKGKAQIEMRTLKKRYTGILGVYARSWINEFENVQEIVDLLYSKLKKTAEWEYVIDNFVDVISKRNALKEHSKEIIQGLKNGDVSYKVILDDLMYTKDDTDELFNLFKESYQNFEEVRLPF